MDSQRTWCKRIFRTPANLTGLTHLSKAIRMSSILFLDFDDVICLNNPFGGYDVLTAFAAANRNNTPLNTEDELWHKLFDAKAAEHLRAIHAEFAPLYVLSTSWRWFFERAAFEQTLELGGLGFIAKHLHQDWSTPQISRQAHRAVEIKTWLAAHPDCANTWVAVDDALSGTGFASWPQSSRQYVVLCQENTGLQEPEYRKLRHALSIRRAGAQR